MGKDIYALGEVPRFGEVPARMHAQLIRKSRFGQPTQAFAREEIQVPELGPRDVLVYVMAAGVNYNNVWAGLGVPVNVIGARNKAGEPEDFHIGGSDASGIVWKVGSEVKSVKVGDEVVAHCGSWDQSDPAIAAGRDPMYIPSFRIWGYETNWGSFAQFTRVQDHQCLPKPKHLSWEEAAAYMLVGATAYRMLRGWSPNKVKAGEPVLIWGGAGELRIANACIEDVDASGPRGLDKSTLRQLGTCGWVREHLNVLISGATGVGKSYLACALGHMACRQGLKVIYRRVPRLFDELSLAKAEGSYARTLAKLAKHELLILDDLGIGQITETQRHDLLEVLDDRYGHGSTLVTSQMPIAQWHAWIGDPTLADAILDRLVHNAHKLTLKGPSRRKENADPNH